MIIEVVNVDFLNKGAELMLRSIVERAKRWDDISLAVPAYLEFYRERALLGMYQRLWIPYIDRYSSVIGGMLPSKYRQLYGVIIESEISGVLDASGFLYSDQWGSNSIKTMVRRYSRLKSQNKSIILLPQAFGPFHNMEVRKLMLELLSLVDLVFVRDKQSFAYLQDLECPATRIRIAPDFTIPIDGEVPQNFRPESRSIAIVPNRRMIDKTTSEVAIEYRHSIQHAVSWFVEREFNPFFLIHDSEDDLDLVNELQRRLSSPIRIISEPNPIYLKGILGTCYMVLGSRYHALVSSLSQGIPAIGIGWSHKYPTLFEDFGCANFCLDPTVTNERIIENMLKSLCDQAIRSKTIEALEIAKARLCLNVELMWDEVAACIRRKYYNYPPTS